MRPSEPDADRCPTQRGRYRCDYRAGHAGECETREEPRACRDKQCHASGETPFLQSQASQLKGGA